MNAAFCRCLWMKRAAKEPHPQCHLLNAGNAVFDSPTPEVRLIWPYPRGQASLPGRAARTEQACSSGVEVVSPPQLSSFAFLVVSSAPASPLL